MDKHEFSKYMNQLFVIFSMESKSHEDIEVIFEAYSKHFLHVDSLIFGKAIDLLIETHPHKTIPTPREINLAIADIKRDMPREQHYGDECEKCSGMGIWIGASDGLAKACSCPIGLTRKANWIMYDTDHPQFKRNREYNEYSQRFISDLAEYKKIKGETK